MFSLVDAHRPTIATCLSRHSCLIDFSRLHRPVWCDIPPRGVKVAVTFLGNSPCSSAAHSSPRHVLHHVDAHRPPIATCLFCYPRLSTTGAVWHPSSWCQDGGHVLGQLTVEISGPFVTEAGSPSCGYMPPPSPLTYFTTLALSTSSVSPPPGAV